MDDLDSQEVSLEQETPPSDVFIAPSIDRSAIHRGESYTYHSELPAILREDASTACVLGVDEAGRGPVLGPMVYGVLYLPKTAEQSLLAETHHFDDSKVLTPQVRSRLLEQLSTPGTDLFATCGWATRVMSARDIGAGMLQAGGTYNLNAQAMDATIALIQEVFARGIHVAEIYIDTIGSPAVYQRKLERIFPTTRITVAKKADSLYPCVSAASVCAKVTRDAALEVAYQLCHDIATGTSKAEDGMEQLEGKVVGHSADGWGSGYPSDARCTAWMKNHLDPLFGWGSECRFSWSTAKDLLDNKSLAFKVDWPAADDEEDSARVTDYFQSTAAAAGDDAGELASWYGRPVAETAF